MQTLDTNLTKRENNELTRGKGRGRQARQRGRACCSQVSAATANKKARSMATAQRWHPILPPMDVIHLLSRPHIYKSREETRVPDHYCCFLTDVGTGVRERDGHEETWLGRRRTRQVGTRRTRCGPPRPSCTLGAVSVLGPRWCRWCRSAGWRPWRGRTSGVRGALQRHGSQPRAVRQPLRREDTGRGEPLPRITGGRRCGDAKILNLRTRYGLQATDGPS